MANMIEFEWQEPPKPPKRAAKPEPVANRNPPTAASDSQTPPTVPSPTKMSSPKEAVCNFNIPPTVLQGALKTLKGPKKSHTLWSHELYRDSAGAKVTVEVCKTLAESEKAVKAFLDEPVLGFDMEWNMWAKDSSPLKENISVIQIACEDRIAVLHLAAFEGTTVEKLVAPSLKKLVESDQIIKTGSNIWRADMCRLRKFFKLQPQAVIELKDMQNLAKFGQLRKSKFSLAVATQEHLLLPLSKEDDVRKGKWHYKKLDEAQLRYAAADAYASYMLFRVLEYRRENLKNIPMRPPFAELELPIENFDSSLGLLRDLKLWRDQFAAAQKKKPDSVVPFVVMQKVSHYQPTTIKKIEKIPGINNYLPLDYPHEIIAVVKAYNEKRKAEATETTDAEAADAEEVREFDPSKFKFSPEQTKASADTPAQQQTAPEVIEISSQESIVSQQVFANQDRDQYNRTLRNLSLVQAKLSNLIGRRANDIASTITLQDIAAQRPQTISALRSMDGSTTLLQAAEAANWSESKLLEEICGMYAGPSKPQERRRTQLRPSTPESSPIVPSLHTGLSFNMEQAALEGSPCPEPTAANGASNSRRTKGRTSRPSVVSISSEDSFEFGTMPTPRKRKILSMDDHESSPEGKRSIGRQSSSSSNYGSAVDGYDADGAIVVDTAIDDDAESVDSFGSSVSSAAWEEALNNSQAVPYGQEKVLVGQSSALGMDTMSKRRKS